MKRPGYRMHYCESCPWRGQRLAHANKLPCPDCGARCFLTSNPRTGGAPRKDTLLVKVWLPRPWVDRLRPNMARKLRRLVSEYLGEPLTDRRDLEVEL